MVNRCNGYIWWQDAAGLTPSKQHVALGSNLNGSNSSTCLHFALARCNFRLRFSLSHPPQFTLHVCVCVHTYVRTYPLGIELFNSAVNTFKSAFATSVNAFRSASQYFLADWHWTSSTASANLFLGVLFHFVVVVVVFFSFLFRSF